MSKLLFLVLIVAQLFPVEALTADPSPQELLQASDRARGGLKGGLVWDLEIESVEDGDQVKRSFEIKARGDDALAVTTSPPRSKGEVLLFNDRSMWFYKPGLRKPVAISGRQKLAGQAANGDIASTHYSRDYEGRITSQEKEGNDVIFVLELKGKNHNVTYDRIRYWIAAKDKLARKAEFLSLEGEVLKSATFEYGNRIEVEGKPTPFVSKMTIVDAKMKENQSTLIYKSPKKKELEPSLFNVNNLIR